MPNISRTKTWNANETLTAADLNAEYNGILTGVNDNALNNDNLNQTDDYLFGSLITGSGLAAAGGDGKLHVHVASAGSVAAHANGNDFVIEGTANPGMSFLSGASTTNSIYFGDVNDNDAGSIVYTHGADMAFTVETAEVLTLAAASVTNNVNTFVGNGYGAVIGHTSQETISDGGGATDVVPEFQVLGTAASDMTAMIGGWSTTATRAAAPVLALVKSGHASIGSHAVVTDGEILGSIIAYGDDGTDLEAPAAAIEFAVDGTPGTGDMPGEIKFYTTADSGEALTLALTLSAAQAATFAGNVTVGVDDAGHDVKIFGNAAGAYMEWDASADQLRLVGASADAVGSSGKLLFATSQTDVRANDILGQIEFQAPLEAQDTDAREVAAAIKAVAQGTFAADLNATDLIFYTGHSEAATEKFRMTSQGEIGIGGANYGTDGHVLTSGGAGAAVAWEAVPTGTDCKFAVYHNAGTANVTGDGTAFTMTYGAEVFDTGSDFASNTFTAPVAGKYLFTCMVSLVGVLAAHTDGRIEIVTTQNDQMMIFSPGKIFESNTIVRPHISAIMDMDAGDTAFIRLNVYNAARVVDLQGTYLSNQFSGAIQ